MASPSRKLDTNVGDDFFVDDTCIDCATCRWVAPNTFHEDGGYSAVYRQPESDEDKHRALMAVVACPTASIGFADKHNAKAARDGFPDPIDDGVYHCGFHAESSFGAASWLYVRDGGNVLVDSPRFNKRLADRIDELGGVRTIFLTHKDDVADHERWAERFGAGRVLHKDDVTRGTRDVEHVIEGEEPIPLADDLVVFPVPGHTKGSACLLADGRFLFTGDHLAWRPNHGGHLYAFRRACWYSWPKQIESMRRLAEWLAPHPVRHVIPGHGRRQRMEPGELKDALAACIDWMEERR